MKSPIIIWQKPEYKRFGRVKLAVLVSPTVILNDEETPVAKNFDHHKWVIPEGVNPFGYKVITIKQLPAKATLKGDGEIDNSILEQYHDWIDRFVQNAPSGKECMLIYHYDGEIAAMIPKKIKLQIIATQMEYPFHQVIMPLPDKGHKLTHGDSIAIEETEGCGWTVPVGTDTSDYWTPIKCCGKGFGFKVHKSRLKSFVDPYPCIDYHPMAEQEAWKYVNEKLLDREFN